MTLDYTNLAEALVGEDASKELQEKALEAYCAFIEKQGCKFILNHPRKHLEVSLEGKEEIERYIIAEEFLKSQDFAAMLAEYEKNKAVWTRFYDHKPKLGTQFELGKGTFKIIKIKKLENLKCPYADETTKRVFEASCVEI